MVKLKKGDILEGIVLEVKQGQRAVINFGNYALEARVLAELEVGQEVQVRVKGKYGKLIVLKVINGEEQGGNGSIDFKA